MGLSVGNSLGGLGSVLRRRIEEFRYFLPFLFVDFSQLQLANSHNTNEDYLSH